MIPVGFLSTMSNLGCYRTQFRRASDRFYLLMKGQKCGNHLRVMQLNGMIKLYIKK